MLQTAEDIRLLNEKISHAAGFTTRINDDERTLSLSIEAITPGKTVSYNKDFDVRGMSQKDKDALVRGIVDSLGLGKKKY